MSAPTITIKAGEQMPRVIYEDTWTWQCAECGWLGVGCSTQIFAIQEAGRHVEQDHPHLAPALIEAEARRTEEARP